MLIIGSFFSSVSGFIQYLVTALQLPDKVRLSTPNNGRLIGTDTTIFPINPFTTPLSSGPSTGIPVNIPFRLAISPNRTDSVNE